MAVTVTTFKARFPEFETTDDARCQVFIDDATAQLSPSFWGSLLDQAISYLAAHYLAVAIKTEEDGGDARTQSIVLERIDALEVRYSESLIEKAAENEYLSTAYGSRYLDLLRRCSSDSCYGV